MFIKYEVVVNETKESKVVNSKEEAIKYMGQVSTQYRYFGGTPSFTILKTVVTKVDIADDWYTNELKDEEVK